MLAARRTEHVLSIAGDCEAAPTPAQGPRDAQALPTEAGLGAPSMTTCHLSDGTPLPSFLLASAGCPRTLSPVLREGVHSYPWHRADLLLRAHPPPGPAQLPQPLQAHTVQTKVATTPTGPTLAPSALCNLCHDPALRLQPVPPLTPASESLHVPLPQLGQPSSLASFSSGLLTVRGAIPTWPICMCSLSWPPVPLHVEPPHPNLWT